LCKVHGCPLRLKVGKVPARWSSWEYSCAESTDVL
jgi:hypothetical protein